MCKHWDLWCISKNSLLVTAGKPWLENGELIYINLLFLNKLIQNQTAEIWVTGHCNRAAVSRNRYGVQKTDDTHKILINAIICYVCLQEIW